MKTIIQIANPEEVGKKYTSFKRASQYIARGVAILTEEGTLYFLIRRQGWTSSKTFDPVRGEFEWSVGESAGYQVMQADHMMRSS